jgi:hypothetical protein
MVLSSRVGDGLPLEVRDHIRSAASERLNVILAIAWACAGRVAGRRAGMLALEFTRHLTRSVSSG